MTKGSPFNMNDLSPATKLSGLFCISFLLGMKQSGIPADKQTDEY